MISADLAGFFFYEDYIDNKKRKNIKKNTLHTT